MLKKIATTVFAIGLLTGFSPAQMWRSESGKIEFQSNAPLEIINAQSAELKALINPANNEFAFSVKNSSFKGFNSTLQMEHFHESYMESHRFEASSFAGKIIEKVDFSKNGTTTIRAKGKLHVHGIERERIIEATMEIKDKTLTVKSRFTVPLNDHNIKIPRLVYQKIADEIQVSVSAAFKFQ